MERTAATNYDPEELLRLADLPYLRLMRPEAALKLLQREARLLDAWGEFLPRYRVVVCEPLAFAYRYLRCLAALDARMLDDLLAHCTWRGVVIGAWLAGLQPRPEYRELLLQARPRAPKNVFLVDLALAAIDATALPEFSEHQRLMAKIARALAMAPKPPVSLQPLVADPAAIAETREIVREIYRSRGADAALAYLAKAPSKTMRNRRSWYRGAIDQGASPIWEWGMTPPVTWDDLLRWRGQST